MASPSDRIGRVCLLLPQYKNVKLRHIQGKLITDIDALSRIQTTPKFSLGDENWIEGFKKLNVESDFSEDIK